MQMYAVLPLSFFLRAIVLLPSSQSDGFRPVACDILGFHILRAVLSLNPIEANGRYPLVICYIANWKMAHFPVRYVSLSEGK